MIQYKRLLKLADFLDKLPRKKFDFTTWVNKFTWGGKADLSCGTTACAMGWATTIPAFRKLGLRLTETGQVCLMPGAPPVANSRARAGRRGPRDGITSAMVLFEILYEEADALFLPEGNGCWIDLQRFVAPPATATPKQVAKHIRRFVELKREVAR
jgi:hypothetical protein